MLVTPPHTRPPMTARAVGSSSTPRRRGPPRYVAPVTGKSTTAITAASSSAAETSRRFTAPRRGARSAVAPEPTIEPTVPPTPMKPKSRFACSLRKTSAMNDQKIETTNMLNTLVQTKKARPVQRSTTDPSPADVQRSRA